MNLHLSNSIHLHVLNLQNVIEESSVAEDASLTMVKYAQTPIMSTYLLAFVVGEFDFVEGKDSDGVNIKVYTPKGKSIQGQFALEVSQLDYRYYIYVFLYKEMY